MAEISADLSSDKRMLRLLQGDVGSGKTLVALLAMAQAIESGRQAALMAPTEILARQHYATSSRWPRPPADRGADHRPRQGVRTSRDARKVASGAIDIAIGTHALVQDEITFADLGLAVIDEQHRFGVHQR